MRAPDMPSGWPSAMAPPFGLTCSASSGRPSCAVRPAPGGEGLVQFDDVEAATAVPAARRACDRRHGSDSHDARSDARRRAAEHARDRRQAMPSTAAAEASSSAAAPSLTPEALPAVTLPPGGTIGRQLRRAPRASCRRAGARRARPAALALASDSSTGDDLAAEQPLACAAAARCCERSANAS